LPREHIVGSADADVAYADLPKITHFRLRTRASAAKLRSIRSDSWVVMADSTACAPTAAVARHGSGACAACCRSLGRSCEETASRRLTKRCADSLSDGRAWLSVDSSCGWAVVCIGRGTREQLSAAVAAAVGSRTAVAAPSPAVAAVEGAPS
jgi:hypothetical protein